MATIYVFVAQAKTCPVFQPFDDTDRMRGAVRLKCGMPTARVEFIKHREWNSPELETGDLSEAMAQSQVAIRGIRKALSDRGISKEDVEMALRAFMATPIQQTGRVLYMVPVRGPSRCFVATACYGAADAPQVAELRRFRDRTLARHPIGVLLIRAYYQLSPPLAGVLGRKPRLRAFVRRYLLDPIVKVIREKRGAA